MPSETLRRVLISTYDKTGLVELARRLTAEHGSELVSTGGTARALQEAGLAVTLVEDLTGFPEILGGRVKTLHPRVHAGILANRSDAGHRETLAAQRIEPFDLVVVNLYPFSETIARRDASFSDAVEMIDIGGPCLLRAAAKNHEHVWVAGSLADATAVLDALADGAAADALAALRRRLAQRVFETTADYDATIAGYLSSAEGRDVNRAAGVGDAAGGETDFPAAQTLSLERQFALRYGENPHQQAALYRTEAAHPFMRALAAEAERLSFNNVVDAAAAYELCGDLTIGFSTNAGPLPAACFIKHTNACGAAIALQDTTLDDSTAQRDVLRRAYLGDPNAAMGGILAVNFPIDAAFAETLMHALREFGGEAEAAGCVNPPRAFFAEVIVAPGFDEAAVEVIRTQKAWGERVRLLAVGGMDVAERGRVVKQVPGGALVQDADAAGIDETSWRVAAQRAPTDAERRDLRLAWLVCKHTKSNAITITKDGMLLGSGAGQMSRVMSCRIATWLARENGHAGRLAGSVAASDAFFPFADGPTLLADAGVRAVIQPGGSKRDEETVALCDAREMSLVMTGRRHFRH